MQVLLPGTLNNPFCTVTLPDYAPAMTTSIDGVATVIINDKHKLVFIHIPKCGGTTVKQSLAVLDERDGLYSRVRNHPVLGRVDYTHLPLSVMRQHFPRDFECIQAYRAFALCREPMDRFLSALLQRIMVYEGQRETLTKEALRAQIERVMDYLSEHETVDDHRFIHFEKQCNFMYIDGEQVVDRIFRLCDMEKMCAEVESYTGVEIRPEAVMNQSLYARNVAVQFLVARVWPIARQFLPRRIADLRHRLKGIIYVPARERLGDVVASSEVRNFVERYYARDLELFHSLRVL